MAVEPRATKDTARMEEKGWKFTPSVIFVILVLLAGIFHSTGLSKPFGQSVHSGNGAFYGVVGRNFARYGPSKFKFAMCCHSRPLLPHTSVYVHHPPGCGFLVYASYLLFGEGETQTRIPFLVLSSIGAGLIFLFFLEISGNLIFSILAYLFSVAAPVWCYYATMPDPQGSGIILSVTGALYFSARWWKTGSTKHLVLSNAFLVFGFFFDWPAYVAAILLGLWSGLSRKGNFIKNVSYFWGPMLFCAFLTLAWMIYALGLHRINQDLMEAFTRRSGLLGRLVDDRFKKLTFLECLEKILEFHFKGVFLPSSMLGIPGLLYLVFSKEKTGKKLLILVFLLTGLFHVLFFMQGSYMHYYWQIYLAPGFGITGAWFVMKLYDRFYRYRMTLLILFFGIGISCLANGIMKAKERWVAGNPRIDEPKALGYFLKRNSPADLIILSNEDMVFPVSYYSDRRIIIIYKKEYINLLTGSWKDVSPFIAGILARKNNTGKIKDLVESGNFDGPVEFGNYLFWKNKRP